MIHGTVVTSTGLSETEIGQLEYALSKKYKDVFYHSKLDSTVSVLVINKNDSSKLWLNSKKFMYVTAYRPDIHVIDIDDVCFSEKECMNIKDISQLKPFEKLQISLCRLEDGLLDKMKNVIEFNGGIATTHLTNETDVMISMIADGKRYEVALEWGIPVVSPDWCYDSVDRGLPLNTKCYKLIKDMTSVVTRINFDGDEDKKGSEIAVRTYNLGRRDEACDWEKLKEWRDNERSRKLEEYIKTKIDKKELSRDEDENQTIFDQEVDSILEEKKRSLNDEDEEYDDKIVKIKKTGKHDELWNSIMNKDKKVNTKLNKVKPFQIKVKRENGPVLLGLKFKIIGYNETEEEKIKKVIAKFGGNIISDGEVDFTVVSFTYNEPLSGDNLITEMAIERFIYNEKIDLGDYLWCRPFVMQSNIKISQFKEKFEKINANDSDKMKISITGFDGTDLSQMERLLKVKLNQWVDFKPTFSQNCDLLVIGLSGHTNTGRQRKQQLARRWNVQVLLVDDFFSKVLELSV